MAPALRFLQTTARPKPVVLFGILSPAGSRRAAATTGLGQRRCPIDILAEKEHGGMQDVLPIGAGVVFRNLRFLLEDLIDRLWNVEGIPLPLDRDVLVDHSRDRLRRRGGTFRHIRCRRTGFFRNFVLMNRNCSTCFPNGDKRMDSVMSGTINILSDNRTTNLLAAD